MQRRTDRDTVPCANRGRNGYALRDCVTRWDRSGDIPGCYRCNSQTHIIDDCRVQPPLTSRTRYEIEVVGRSGRPPLRARQGWNELAIEHQCEEPGPISRQVMATIPYNQFADWDYSRDHTSQSHLAVYDRSTHGWEIVRDLPDQGYRAGPNDMRGYNTLDNREALLAHIDELQYQDQQAQAQPQQPQDQASVDMVFNQDPVGSWADEVEENSSGACNDAMQQDLSGPEDAPLANSRVHGKRHHNTQL